MYKGISWMQRPELTTPQPPTPTIPHWFGWWRMTPSGAFPPNGLGPFLARYLPFNQRKEASPANVRPALASSRSGREGRRFESSLSDHFIPKSSIYRAERSSAGGGPTLLWGARVHEGIQMPVHLQRWLRPSLVLGGITLLLHLLFNAGY